uniref:Immunoglobulin subtype domain-containing protein n=1 Tax=Myripristis murdjan TaxID=586833 RepID=A0A667Z7B5_9TELE
MSSTAVTSRFVLKGEDVTLDVQKPDIQEETIFEWKFKREDNVVRLVKDEVFVFTNYRGRVEFSSEDYSLLLKSLTEADSGVYTAVLFGDKDMKVAEYEVTVQEPVSPVHLTVKPVSSSSDSCNVTVTCSSQDSSISSTLTCDGGDCFLEGGERSEVTASATAFRVHVFDGSVICNHSNQVSWRQDRIEIDARCWPDTFSQASCFLSFRFFFFGFFFFAKVAKGLYEGQVLNNGSNRTVICQFLYCDEMSCSPACCVPGPQSPSGVSVYLVRTVVLSVGLIIMVSVVIGVNLLDRLKKKE